MRFLQKPMFGALYLHEYSYRKESSFLILLFSNEIRCFCPIILPKNDHLKSAK